MKRHLTNCEANAGINTTCSCPSSIEYREENQLESQLEKAEEVIRWYADPVKRIGSASDYIDKEIVPGQKARDYLKSVNKNAKGVK